MLRKPAGNEASRDDYQSKQCDQHAAHEFKLGQETNTACRILFAMGREIAHRFDDVVSPLRVCHLLVLRTLPPPRTRTRCMPAKMRKRGTRGFPP
jgi:hypothetical protein